MREFKTYDMEQGSIEWHEIRHAKITGTRFGDLLKKDSDSLIDTIIAEKENQEVEIESGFINEEMQRGKDMEPIARNKYQKQSGSKLLQFGFIESTKYPLVGYSPDAIIEEENVFIGGLEIKCPKTKTHVKYIRQDIIPTEYRSQILCSFVTVNEMEWLDFISFDDRFKIKPMFIKRVYREDLKNEILLAKNAIERFNEKFLKAYEDIKF